MLRFWHYNEEPTCFFPDMPSLVSVDADLEDSSSSYLECNRIALAFLNTGFSTPFRFGKETKLMKLSQRIPHLLKVKEGSAAGRGTKK